MKWAFDKVLSLVLQARTSSGIRPLLQKDMQMGTRQLQHLVNMKLDRNTLQHDQIACDDYPRHMLEPERSLKRRISDLIDTGSLVMMSAILEIAQLSLNHDLWYIASVWNRIVLCRRSCSQHSRRGAIHTKQVFMLWWCGYPSFLTGYYSAVANR